MSEQTVRDVFVAALVADEIASEGGGFSLRGVHPPAVDMIAGEAHVHVTPPMLIAVTMIGGTRPTDLTGRLVMRSVAGTEVDARPYTFRNVVPNRTGFHWMQVNLAIGPGKHFLCIEVEGRERYRMSFDGFENVPTHLPPIE